MSERGYIRLRDSSGRDVYAEFSINSVETVQFVLTQEDFGTETPLDLSSASLTAYFRGSLKGSTSVPVNVALSNVTDGTNGQVTGEVVFRRADFPGAAENIECAVVVVNSTVVDATTTSGFQETIWKGRWRSYLREGMNEA